MQQTNTAHDPVAPDDEANTPSPDERLAELWDGPFHLAYDRWLAETRKRVAQGPVAAGTGAEVSRRNDVQPRKQPLE